MRQELGHLAIRLQFFARINCNIPTRLSARKTVFKHILAGQLKLRHRSVGDDVRAAGDVRERPVLSTVQCSLSSVSSRKVIDIPERRLRSHFWLVC